MTIILSSTSSSGFGITNYGELKEAIAAWLNKTNLTDRLPDFVRLAETTIRRDVRVRAQEEIESDTAADETIDVPELLLEFRRFTVGGHVYSYITPEQYQEYTDAGNTTARHYTIIGQSIYIVGGATDASYSLLYWKAFAAFSSDTDSNWLLLNAPEIYLWLGCREGAEYLKDFEAADRFSSKYTVALRELNLAEKNMRASGSSMHVRVRGSTP